MLQIKGYIIIHYVIATPHPSKKSNQTSSYATERETWKKNNCFICCHVFLSSLLIPEIVGNERECV